jgi:hypothetical protein
MLFQHTMSNFEIFELMNQEVLKDTLGKEHKVTYCIVVTVLSTSNFCNICRYIKNCQSDPCNRSKQENGKGTNHIEFDRKEIPDDQKLVLEKRLQSLYSKECSMYNAALRLQEQLEHFELEVSVTTALIDTNNDDETMVESKISEFESELDNKLTEQCRRSVLRARLDKLYVVRDYLC